MSMHPSLSSSQKNKKQRSVLKRIERLRLMMEKGQWKEEDSVYGLPKIKTIRFKLKKEKAVAEKPEAEVAAVAEGAEGSAPVPAESETKKPETKKPETKKQ